VNAGAPLKLVRAKFVIRMLSAAILAAAVLAGCTGGHSRPAASAGAQPAGTVRGPGTSTAQKPRAPHEITAVPPRPGVLLPPPTALTPVPGTGASAGQGVWQAAGRLVHGRHAVYVTMLIPPGGREPAGIAWMDTGLLSARLYSGSISPGGGPYKYTAPVQRAQAATLVAAFNGGFKMANARGGYYTEGRTIFPLRRSAASLVIYADGSVNIGAWGTDVTMTSTVVSVRQNLTPLVIDGKPSSVTRTPDFLRTWGNTLPALRHQWRSGAGITADGALVYVTGPALSPEQLADLLVRAGVVRGMQLDINPYWTVFVSYDPAAPGGLAAPANGSKLLPQTTQGPATFFTTSWARDFITMAAR
jgi:Phosphodiester glycosidase